MTLYAVEVRFTAIVDADDVMEAEEIARDDLRDIASQCGPVIEVRHVINRLDDLRICNYDPRPPHVVEAPWDGDCFPYGNPDQRIKELVPIKDDMEN